VKVRHIDTGYFHNLDVLETFHPQMRSVSS
jgi:hypothetical protein